MPKGTEREAKERQGQNWPGKNSLPNFPMKIKVAPFVFTNQCLSIKMILFFFCVFLLTWGPFEGN